ncbi:MAG: tetratricopeptide repeat protein, partial [SAR324 cluster bacterium]|nr:tetratricopeptide repeat protein [SAR324 cluster bacterium]
MVRFAIGLLAFLFLAFSASSFGQAQKFQPFTFNDEQIRNLSPDERFKIERNVKLLGYKAYKNGNFLRALGFFKMAIQINPGNHFNYSHAAQSAIKIGKKEQAARFLKRAVTAAIKKKSYTKIEDYNRDIQGIYSILPKTPEIRRALLQWNKKNQESFSLYGKGRYRDAIEPARQAWEIARLHFGNNNSYTLVSMTNLAEMYRSQGLYGKARPLVEQGLKQSRALLGNNHPNTLASIAVLAALNHSQG